MSFRHLLTSVLRAGVNVSFSISWDGEGEVRGAEITWLSLPENSAVALGTLGGAIEEISRSVVAGKQAEWQ